MPWPFSLPEHVVKPLFAFAAAVAVALIGLWRYPRSKRGPSSGERLANIEGRLGSVESEVKQTRQEMNAGLAEIRGYVMQNK